MNWMLVLFMGSSSNYNIVKTDLIFATNAECFSYEQTMAKRSVDAMNYFLKDRKKDGDNTNVDQAANWAAMQYPRGTCIPTTSKKTVN
jgi:hypothetical protein